MLFLRQCGVSSARASRRGASQVRQIASQPAYFTPLPFPELPELLRKWNNVKLPEQGTGTVHAVSQDGTASPFDEEPLIPLVFDILDDKPAGWLRPQVVRELRSSRLTPVYSRKGELLAMAFGPTLQKNASLVALSPIISKWRRDGKFKDLLHGKHEASWFTLF
jgi:hypothetical protein